jgi:hypothetical protein
MKRFYRLTDNTNKLINIDDISVIDYDASTNKYIVFIHGLDYSIYINKDDAFVIMDKLQIINDF